MTSPKITALALGIQRAEGWFAIGEALTHPNGSQSYINHNPGNLRSSKTQTSVNNGFAVFLNDQIGMDALEIQLLNYAAGRVPGISESDIVTKMLATYTGLDEFSIELKDYLTTALAGTEINGADLISTLID